MSEKTEELEQATTLVTSLTTQIKNIAESFDVEISADLSDLGSASTGLTDIVESIRASTTTLNETISSLNGTITEHEATIKTLNEEASVDSETIAALKEQLSQAQETIKALGVREESVEIQALKAQNKKLTDELESSTKTVEECQRAIKRYQKQVEVLRTALTSKQSHDEKISGNGMNI